MTDLARPEAEAVRTKLAEAGEAGAGPDAPGRATRQWDDPDGRWTVLADPEGNLLCVFFPRP